MIKSEVTRGIAISAALLLATAIAACGGSGGLAGGGIGGTGKSVGAITAFGSIFVNGVEFEIDGTTKIIIDDDDVSAFAQSDLALGMVVEVEGEFSPDGISGVAETVIYDDSIEGPIDTLDLVQKTITVLGQNIRYTTSTQFYDDILDLAIAPVDLSENNVIEVSGLVDPTGTIVATRIEKKADTFPAAGIEIEVEGQVESLSAPFTFVLRMAPSVALTIDYSAVMPDGTLTDGVFVEVKSSNPPSGGLLTATSVEVEDREFGIEGYLLEVEGFINDDSPATGDFEVDGLPVTIDATTQFRNGDSTDILFGAQVEVEGLLADDLGTLVLVAREVEFEIEDEIEIEAPLEGINTSSNILSILGLSISYGDPPSTEFEDKTEAVEFLLDSDLIAGDWLRIRGILDSSGSIVAQRIERDDPDTRVVLEGPVSNIARPDFDIFVVGITTIEDIGGTDFRADEDNQISADIFFSNLFDGRFVKVKGTYNVNPSNPAIIAQEVQLGD